MYFPYSFILSLTAREFLRLELGEHEKELYHQVFTLTRSILASFAYEAEAYPYDPIFPSLNLLYFYFAYYVF